MHHFQPANAVELALQELGFVLANFEAAIRVRAARGSLQFSLRSACANSTWRPAHVRAVAAGLNARLRRNGGRPCSRCPWLHQTA